MPTVRIRRSTYSSLAPDTTRPPQPGRQLSTTAEISPLDPIVGSSEPDGVTGVTAQRPDSRPSDEIQPKDQSQSPEGQEGGDRGVPLTDISETAKTAQATQNPARPRANTLSQLQRTGGRPRSKTIAAILGDQIPPPPVNVLIDKGSGPGHTSTEAEGTSSLPPLATIPEPPQQPPTSDHTLTMDKYQSRVERATQLARVRGESISAGSGSAQVGLTFTPPPDRTSSERANKARDSVVAAADSEDRVGLPTGRRRTLSRALPFRRKSEAEITTQEDDHHMDEVVEHLDVIDPQVATVGSLQNCANTIMIPNIPSLWSRKPVLTLPETPSSELSEDEGRLTFIRRRSSISTHRPPSPHGSTDSLTPEERAEDALDKHVEHVLRKRDKAKRILRGFWAFVKTPIGAITAIYGFLCAFWGAAIVLFLLGWIDTGSAYNKKLWVEISSQIENGLFTITGVGFIPWRVRDAWRISIIWRLKRRSVKLRAKQGLPPIERPDDLPDPDLDPDYVPVLTEKQQAQLQNQQEKFMASQTWYRPHATETHRAFPIAWALWICFLIIGNSFFQVILCCCMWSMNRFQRPPWTTGTLIPLSFLCGIAAAVMIWKGGERTKKKKQVEAKLRRALGVDDDLKEKGQPGGDVTLQRSPSDSVGTVSKKRWRWLHREKKTERVVEAGY